MQSKTIAPVESKKYPVLKINSENCIVLFTRIRRGVVVSSGSSISSIGVEEDTWLESNFHLYEGSVELSNN